MANLDRAMFTENMISETAKKLNIQGKIPELHIANDEAEMRAIGELSQKSPVLVATWARTSAGWWHEIIGDHNNNVVFSKGRPKGASVGVAVVYLGVPDEAENVSSSVNDTLSSELAQTQAELETTRDELSKAKQEVKTLTEQVNKKQSVDLSGLHTVVAKNSKPLTREYVAPEASVTIEKLLGVGILQSDIARRVNITSTQVRRLSQSNYGDYKKRKQINESLFEIAKEVGLAND